MKQTHHENTRSLKKKALKNIFLKATAKKPHKKLHGEGTDIYIERYINRRTSRLLDQNSPVGRFGEKVTSYFQKPNNTTTTQHYNDTT